jgi:hypothetical protein
MGKALPVSTTSFTRYCVLECDEITDLDRKRHVRDAEVVRLEIVHTDGSANHARNRAMFFGL